MSLCFFDKDILENLKANEVVLQPCGCDTGLNFFSRLFS